MCTCIYLESLEDIFLHSTYSYEIHEWLSFWDILCFQFLFGKPSSNCSSIPYCSPWRGKEMWWLLWFLSQHEWEIDSSGQESSRSESDHSNTVISPAVP